jgi:hypothetical protein
MEESQVTVDGSTYLLPKIFMVMPRKTPSTQAPTRFPRRSSTGSLCASRSAIPPLIRGVHHGNAGERTPDSSIAAVPRSAGAGHAEAVRNACREVGQTYIAQVVEATRRHPHVMLGGARGVPWGSCGRPRPWRP